LPCPLFLLYVIVPLIATLTSPLKKTYLTLYSIIYKLVLFSAASFDTGAIYRHITTEFIRRAFMVRNKHD